MYNVQVVIVNSVHIVFPVEHRDSCNQTHMMRTFRKQSQCYNRVK